MRKHIVRSRQWILRQQQKAFNRRQLIRVEFGLRDGPGCQWPEKVAWFYLCCHSAMLYLPKRHKSVEETFDAAHWTIMFDDDDAHGGPGELNDKNGTRLEAFSQFNGLKRVGDQAETTGLSLPDHVYTDIQKRFVQCRSPSSSLTLRLSARLTGSQRGSVEPMTLCQSLTCGSGPILHKPHLHTCLACVFDQDS